MNPIDFAMACMLVCLKWRGSVTSWGRTEERNVFVGGQPGSLHLNWLGMDIVLDEPGKNTEFERDCAALGVSGLYEEDHYHLQPK